MYCIAYTTQTAKQPKSIQKHLLVRMTIINTDYRHRAHRNLDFTSLHKITKRSCYQANIAKKKKNSFVGNMCTFTGKQTNKKNHLISIDDILTCDCVIIRSQS